MTKKIRNFLFLFFVIIFVLLSAWILAYAFGYSLTPYGGLRLQKTGIFDIETQPRGAVVYLNGKIQNKFLNKLTGKQLPVTTPVKLSGITAGDYEVSLNLSGYHGWQKTLSIKPGETTFLENVHLFKDTLPQLAWSLDINRLLNVQADPGKKTLAVLTDNQVVIADCLDGSQIASFSLADSTSQAELSWSADSRSLIANRHLINLDTKAVRDLKTEATTSASRFVFGADSDKMIYFADELGLFQFDSASKEKKLLIKPQKDYAYTDWLAKDGYLYLIKRDDINFSSQIVIYRQDESEPIGQIDLIALTNYRFINVRNKWLNLYDDKNHALYLFDIKYPFNNEYSSKRLDNVYFNEWQQSDTLLIAGQNDLRLWQQSDNQEKLLTRLGQPITAAFRLADGNYIVFATANSLNALEIDDRNGRQHTKLLDNLPLRFSQISPDGKKILFFTKLGNSSGLYSLDLE